MEIEIVAKKDNLLLKRKEIQFKVNHAQDGSTPPRTEVRKAVAATLKTGVEGVFIKRFVTKTGMHMAFGVANVYDSAEQAKHVEPRYIVKRNIPEVDKPKVERTEQPPQEKPKEETKG